MHQQKNIHTCDTCISFRLISDGRGQCMEKRLSDIARRYSNSLQPDRLYYPRINFQVTTGFGCVHHINIIKNA